MIPNGWVPIGPSGIFNGQMADGGTAPTSGRVTAIAVDLFNADIVYAGTATGGVWKTTDRGMHWKPIMDNQLTLSVGSIAIDPRQTENNPRVYIATGEGNEAGETLPGVGVYIYTEAPDPQWTLLGNAKLNGRHIYKIQVIAGATPADKNTILLATDNGLWESTDDGQTWNKLQLTADPNSTVTDLVYNATTTDLFAATYSNAVYKRTGHSGLTALPQGGQGDLPGNADLRRVALAICDTDPKNMCALFGKKSDKECFIGLWVTNDGGTTWTRRKMPNDTGHSYYNLVVGMHPSDPNTIIAGGKDLWKSGDGGASWTHVSYPTGDSVGTHADQHAIAFSPKDAKAVWAGNDGGVWLSPDKGDSFFQRNRGLQTIQFYSIAHNPNEASIIIGGSQDNGSIRYEGSPSWDLTSEGDGFFCAIDPVEPSRCYSSYVYQQGGKIKAIQRSEKWGKPGSWSRITDGITNTFPPQASTPFYVPFIIDPKDHKVLYLGTNRLYRSENYGDDWVEVKDASQAGHPSFSTGATFDLAITAIAVDPNDNTIVYAGTHDGRVIKLNQDASDKNLFTPVSTSPPPTPGPPTAFISDLAVPPIPVQNLVNPVLVAYGSPQLTGDLDDLPFGRIVINQGPDNARAWLSLYDPHLDITVDGVQVKHSSNPVNAIAIDPVAVDPQHFKVYIGCDTGVFVREGLGAGVWTLYNENLPNVAIGDLKFHEGKRLLRAATMGRSVWERDVDKQPGNTVDIYIRDNIVDVGRPPTPQTDIDPTSGDQVTPVAGVDVKIDTPFLGIAGFTKPVSTVDYTPAGAADYMGFAQLGSDNLRRGVTSRIYAQVINRGPADATQVQVRGFYASRKPDGTYPQLDNGFWSKFDTTDPSAQGWTPLGNAVAFDTLHPAEPAVASWDYKMPEAVSDTVGILMVCGAKEDSIFPPPATNDVAEAARSEKHVALREVSVGIPPYAVIILVLLAVGTATAIGVGIGEAVSKKH